MKKLALLIFVAFIASNCNDDESTTPAPTIESFSPGSGTVGASVTINGTNFHEDTNKNTVKFNNTPATVISATPFELIAEVPATATSGKIAVTVGGKTAVSSIDFTVLLPPTISSFTPQQGGAGTLVTISGSNFSSVIGQNTVKFNGVSASISSATSTSLTASVPETATSGKLSIEVNGFSTVSTSDFSITHTITSFTPSNGPAGTLVEISGKNFSTVLAENVVKFNGTVATVTEASSLLLKAEAPPSAGTGKISVEIDGVLVNSTQNFIYPPVITSFTPAEGINASFVSIIGINFNSGAANNSVSFNGVAATISSATTTQIVTRVPVGSSTGKITVTSNGLTGESSQDFIVSPWAPLQSLTTARLTPEGFVIGTKAYIIGGIGALAPLGDVWEYDPQTNQWTQKADFPGSLRGSAVAFSIGSKGYYGTGIEAGTGNKLKDFWEFDPQANSWIQKADFSGTARFLAAGFSIDNYGYIGTGNDGSPTLRSDFYKYDPVNNSWSQISDFGGGERWAMSGFTIQGKAYWGLGYGAGQYKTDFWEYNPTSNQWTPKADFPGSTRNYTVTFVANDKGYIGLGNNNGGAHKDLWIYNPVFNIWAQKKDFWDGTRTEAKGFGINGKGYVTSGLRGSTRVNDLWEYDPAKDN